MDLIRDLVHAQGLTAVVATHDPALIGLADEVVDLRDGRVVARPPAAPSASPSVGQPLA